MAMFDIRLVGDPVLREVATDVTDIDDGVDRLVWGMFMALHRAPGIAVAAPQVGVSRRVVVWQLPEVPLPDAIINPRIVEFSDEQWLFTEGCLSMPGVYLEIERPKRVHVVGLDLNGDEISIEADTLEARMFQHEIDHLDGILMTDPRPRSRVQGPL